MGFVSGPAAPSSACVGLSCPGTDGEECYAFSTTEAPRPWCLTVPRRIGAWGGEVSFRPDGAEHPSASLPLVWDGFCLDHDRFSFSLPTDTLSPGLYFFSVTVACPEGMLGVSPRGNGEAVLSGESGQICGQFTVYHRAYPSCEWLMGGVIYHIFVDRFARGRETPLGQGNVYNPDWNGGMPQYPPYPGAPLANNMFFGGNLSGITAKLPYLAGLGVTCLYLSPIFDAASNHKYDTGDYSRIDPAFGTEDDLRELIDRAAELGIRIILDGVFNHTGSDSLYFNQKGRYDSVGAWQSPDSPYAGWYTFHHFPDRYDCWWDIPILPKLNLRHPDVRSYFLGEDGIVARWARMGIGGMRLDVADELDDDFIASVKHRLAESDPQNVLLGEVWEDASDKIAYDVRKTYYLGRELDGVMNYPLRRGILSFCKDGRTEELSYALLRVMANCPREVRHTQMNFLGTHDTERVLSALGDLDYAGQTNDRIAHMKMTRSGYAAAQKRLLSAFSILFTLPGIPSVYYGDEAGMEGYKDPFNRLPYPWKHPDKVLRDAVAALAALRREHPVFRSGGFGLLFLSSNCFAFCRYGEGECLLTVVNRADSPLHVCADKSLRPLWGGQKTGEGVLVPPCSAAILDAGGAGECRIYR